MNTIDRIFQDRAQFARRMTPDHRCQVSVLSRRDPDLQFTDTKFFQRPVVTSGEGIAREILNCAQHSRHHVGVFGDRRIEGHV